MPLFLDRRAFRAMLSICGHSKLPTGGEDVSVHRCTPAEAKRRRKAYDRRKAAKTARRRNRNG